MRAILHAKFADHVARFSGRSGSSTPNPQLRDPSVDGFEVALTSARDAWRARGSSSSRSARTTTYSAASRGISRSSASAHNASSPAKGPRDKATRVGYRPLSLDRSGSLLQSHKGALSDVSETDEDARGARKPAYSRATYVSRVQQR